MMLKSVNNKRVALIIFFLCVLLHARWIPFKQEAAESVSQVDVLYSNTSSIILNVKVTGAKLEEIETKEMINTEDESFVLFSIPDGYHTGEIGKPQLPTIKKTIGVPYDARINIEVVHSEYRDIPLQKLGIEKRIMPALAPVLKLPGEKPVFVIDDETYSQDALNPEVIAKIVSDDIMRGHRLAVIEIIPIRYNPVARTIRCYTNIEIRINFVGGDIVETREKVVQNYSPIYEDFIKRRVLNYGFYEAMTRDIVPLPIHYLIITHNNFQSEVNNLAYWLTKKGFKVKVANQDSINPWNITNIENYIDAQAPQPTYLLLVGDVNGGYMPAPIGSASLKVTDLYYAETDGSGYYPDIFYGRLSVETPTHISTVVNKILKYEKAQLPTPATWFKKNAFLAGVDNHTISEGTHNYCTSTFMDPNGYTTYKLYVYTYGATTADVFSNVNEGRILTTMSGHGSDDGWHDGPPFTVTHVNQLTNGDKLTIATGHCCLANNFGSSTNPCGGESWIRKENGGAVAYYGSCPSTVWNEDDWLQREWYEAIYVDSIYEHARFTLDGMYDGVELSGSSLKQYYYEGYHVLGDPSLDLWTEIPDSMIVSHSLTVPPSPSSFTVTVKDNDGVTPLENALVCCWVRNQVPTMHISDYTNASGMVSLNISPMNPGDTMYVTVTKHNYLPHEGFAFVSGPGPYVTYCNHSVSDPAPGGNNNGQINPGETVYLPTWVKNWGQSSASNVYGKLRSTDPYVTLLDSLTSFGNLDPGDSALTSPNFRVAISTNAPNGHALAFTLMTYAAGDTWNSNFSEVVAAPEVVYFSHTIDDAASGNNNSLLEPGEVADLIVYLRNQGLALAPNVSATISTTDPYLTITTDSAGYGDIPPDNTMQCLTPYVVEADSLTPTPHMAQVMINITAIGYNSVDTFGVLIGTTGFYDSVEDTAVTNQYTVEGQWHRTQRRSYSSTHAWWNGNEGTGQYSNNVDASIISPLITLGANMQFECWNWYNLEPNYDYGYIEVSTNGGTSWSQLTSFNGTSGDRVQYSTALNYPAGTQIKIRFRLYTDYSVTREGWYVDEVRVFDYTGVSESEFNILAAPQGTKFLGVYPNPFKRSSQINYQLAKAARVSLGVYDVSGRLVKCLSTADETKEPGYYTLSWDGKDDVGRRVPAGVYFVKFIADPVGETQNYQRVEKTVLLR